MLRPAIVTALLLATLPARPQATGIVSIGDAVRTSDTAAARARSVHTRGLTRPTAPRPIHILYVHGINQVGAGDSATLRKAICHFLHACTVTPQGRLYAAGPFTTGATPPPFANMGAPIWTSNDDWSASAPFIDRYRIEGDGHIPIVLDEINWWPVVYPVKCKWLIEHDASLTGPARAQLNICAAAPTGTQPDPARAGRFLSYQWIPSAQISKLGSLHRIATIGNRNLKNGLMDWGFADAVLALGPTQQILYAGIRELLVQSLQADGVDLANIGPHDPGPEYYFITHSLGSYLALATLDTQSFSPNSDVLPAFTPTSQQKTAVDYLSAHTAGFFFLANQIELLELAHVGPSQSAAPSIPCPVAPSTDAQTATNAPSTPAPSAATPAGTAAPATITHWQCERAQYVQQQSATAAAIPQIIAWSDPNDLLSWNVPAIDGVHVVNIPVRNAAFGVPPFLVSPTGAHANYAQNRKILRAIFAPTPKS